MSTQGWKEMRAIMEMKIASLRMPKNISKKKDYSNIAIEVIGKAYAVRTVERWLKELDAIDGRREVIKNKPFI